MIKKLVKDFAIYGIGDLLLKAISIFTFPIYTRLFSVEDYGILSTVATITGLIAAVLVLGGDSAYARYFFEAEDETDKQVVTSTTFFALFVWSLAIVLLFLPFSNFVSIWTFDTPEHSAMFGLSLAAIPFTLANSICSQALRNQFRPALFSILSAATVILTIAATLIGVLWLHLGIKGVLIGGLVAAIVMLPIRLWFIRDLIRMRFSSSLLWKLLAYGLPLVPTSLAYWIFASSDRIVLSQLSTLEQVGLYSVANQICMVGMFLNNALGQAWSPHAIELFNENEQQASISYGNVMNYILFGFGLFCVAISTFARETLLILATPEFVGAASAVAPLALGFVAYGTTQVTGIGISLKKKTYYFAIFAWLAAILNLILNILTVPYWGMLASSWATAASYLFLTLSYLVVAQRLFFIQYQIRMVLALVLFIFVFTIGTYWLPQPENLAVTLILKTLYFIFFCFCGVFCLMFFNIQYRQRISLNQLYKRLSQRFVKNKI